MTGDDAGSQPLDIPEIERRWLEACADADIKAGTEAQIAVIPGDPPQAANYAIHFHPGSTVYADETFPLTRAQLDHFNEASVRRGHRIAAFTKVEPRVLSGLFRHELQHARQYRSHPEAYHVSDLANAALGEAYGPRPGGAVLYNAAPIEEDANAAASWFLRKLDGDPSEAELRSTQAQLFRPVELPWTEEDLPTETLAFLALHPDELESILAHRQGSIAPVIASLHPNAEVLWRDLRDDAEFQAARARFANLPPTDKQIVAAGERPGDAWQPLAHAFAQARMRARAVIHEH